MEFEKFNIKPGFLLRATDEKDNARKYGIILSLDENKTLMHYEKLAVNVYWFGTRKIITYYFLNNECIRNFSKRILVP